MAKARRNPFPDYPVTRLQDKSMPKARTILTPQIQESRSRIEEYADFWTTGTTAERVELKPKPLFISVRGDYGVGKTYLLLDAISTLPEKLSGKSKPTIIRLSCLETDPVAWYRTGIGPALETAPLADAMSHIYAKAGARVADEARLTESAVERLRKEPRFIYSLVNENLLNRTAVDQMLRQILRTDCDITEEHVANAFVGLVWDQTAAVAMRWLAGSELSATELDSLRIPASLTDEATATAALTGLASIHTFVRRPFGLFIDELEHLVRYDTVRNGRHNITWLKRLLEGLSSSGVLAFIAGHWSAWEEWEAKPDSPGRLSAQPQIRLWKLTASDVNNIIRAWVVDSGSVVFDIAQAQAVVDITDGNLRRVLSLLRVLFNATDGFQRFLGAAEIKSLAEQSGQKISLEDAKLRVHEILERRGLQVQSPAVVSNISFDLVGYETGEPAIIVEFKHPALQEEQGTSYFFSRVLSAQSLYPRVIGFFVVDGNIDKQALAALKNPGVPIVVFDLTQSDVLTKLSAEVDEHLGGRRPPDFRRAMNDLASRQQSLLEQIQAAQSAKDYELAKTLAAERENIQDQLSKVAANYQQFARSLEQQVGTIERQRQEEARELRQRIQELTSVLRSDRDKSLIDPTAATSGKSTVDNKLAVTYAELTRPPALSARLSYAINYQVVLCICSVITSFFLSLWIGQKLADYARFTQNAQYLSAYFQLRLWSYFSYIALGAGLLGAVWITLRRVRSVDQYYEFSARMLRELYVRSSNPESLVTADHLLRTSFEDHGPVHGKEVATEALLKTFPEVFEMVARLQKGPSRSR